MALQIEKAIVKGRLFNSVETRNIYHYSCEGTVRMSEIEKGNLEGQLDEIYAAWSSMSNSNFVVYEYEFQYWDGEEWQPDVTIAKNILGTETVDLSSFQAAILFVGRTVTKSVIARKFFPGVDELFTELGAVAVGALIYTTAIAGYMLETITGDLFREWFPCTHSGQYLSSPVVSWVVGQVMSTMRRRKPGYGI